MKCLEMKIFSHGISENQMGTLWKIVLLSGVIDKPGMMNFVANSFVAFVSWKEILIYRLEVICYMFLPQNWIGFLDIISFFFAGLCSDSLFDTKYSWTKQFVNNRYTFRGYKDTFLSYDADSMEWRLQLYSDPYVYATSINTTDYPFGTRLWTVYNDSCFEEATKIVDLNLNACQDSEFNCGDGHCVSIDQRCNGRIDCQDRTGIDFML